MPVGLYVPVYLSLPDHRKTVRMVALLREDKYKVIGHLVALWLWAMTSADETGMIQQATPDELAIAAHWSGRAEDWESALVLSGYLERHDAGYVIHDWPETGGKVLREQRLDRERWANRKKDRPSGRHSSRPPARGGQPEVYSGVHSTGAPPEPPPVLHRKTRRDFKDSSVGSTDLVEGVVPTWFGSWWAVYTSISGRGRNKRGTLALAARLPASTREQLVALTKQHAERWTAARLAGVFVAPWPDPERYIKHRGWEDEYVLPQGATAAEPAPPDGTTLLIREQIDHGADPLWPEYERLVLAHRIPVDWQAWRQARAEAS